MSKNIKVGDKVGLKTVNNLARYGTLFYEGVITKIGRKYFYVKIEENNREVSFEIDSLLENNDYSADYEFYYSLQEAKDSLLITKMKKKIIKELEYNGNQYSVKQLQDIMNILELK